MLVPFRTIVGHRRLVSLISRAIARETLPPSLLLAGPSGVGKRTTATAIALAVNCVQPRHSDQLERDSCGECASCLRIGRGVHPDVIIVEPGETASIKVEQVRAVIDTVGFRPFEAHRRIVIVDEADAMVHAAQSALLKTLEEPPSASLFLLVSSKPDALLSTVVSRCPRLRFGALSATEVSTALMERHDYSDGDARAAAADADGSIGRALAARSADLATARESACRLLELTARTPDPARRFELARDLVGKKRTPAEEREQLGLCLLALSSLLRDMSILTVQGDARLVVNADLGEALGRLAASVDIDRAMSSYKAVDGALDALGRNASSKVVADWLVLRL